MKKDLHGLVDELVLDNHADHGWMQSNDRNSILPPPTSTPTQPWQTLEPDTIRKSLAGLKTPEEAAKERIDNNFSYHPPKEGQQAKYVAIRSMAKELALLIEDTCPASREKSLANTKLEEAVMWANASIARNE